MNGPAIAGDVGYGGRNNDHPDEPETEHMLGTTGNSQAWMNAGMAGAGALISMGDPVLGAVVAVATPLLERVGEQLKQQQARNTAVLINDAAKSASLQPEELIERIIKDPAGLVLLASAVDAARRTTVDAKIKALAESLAALAEDDALLDDTSIWISIFTQIDAAHIRVVHALCEGDPENEGYGRLWKRHELRERFGLSMTISTVINTLLSVGLAREVRYDELSNHDRARWSVNPPGPSYSPVYGKGPLVEEFLKKLGTVADGSGA